MGVLSPSLLQMVTRNWLCFSTAEESLPPGFAPDALKNEFQDVMSYLGLKKNSYKIYDYRVRKLSEHRQAVLENLIEIKKEFNPEIVFGPSINDFHQDHGVVANEMIRAFKSTASIFSYEFHGTIWTSKHNFLLS